ncbi:MAG: hypothetical protein JO301_09405 [Chitinophagaceae bacterium]|nr:hypothetical protein [Chitinophagaceae bacterium]
MRGKNNTYNFLLHFPQTRLNWLNWLVMVLYAVFIWLSEKYRFSFLVVCIGVTLLIWSGLGFTILVNLIKIRNTTGGNPLKKKLTMALGIAALALMLIGPLIFILIADQYTKG